MGGVSDQQYASEIPRVRLQQSFKRTIAYRGRIRDLSRQVWNQSAVAFEFLTKLPVECRWIPTLADLSAVQAVNVTVILRNWADPNQSLRATPKKMVWVGAPRPPPG